MNKPHVLPLLTGVILTGLFTLTLTGTVAAENSTVTTVGTRADDQQRSRTADESAALVPKALDAFSRSYFPGRSGQIMFVPKRNTTFLQGWKSFEHGSPWDYDAHIPLLFYGPAHIKPGEYAEPTRMVDIVSTQAKVLKTAPPGTAQGRPITQILLADAARPKAILTLVLDGVGYSLLEEHLDKMPNLSALKQKGGWFTNHRIDYLPTATAVSHAVVGTGAYPALTGIVANKNYFDATGKMEVPWLEGKNKAITPRNLNSWTLADSWDLQMDNQPIIVGVCWIPRAVGGMIGHGAYIANADKDIFVAYNKKSGALINNRDYYRLPEYLAEFDIKAYWEKSGKTFLGHNIDDFSKVRFSPVMPSFMADVFLEVLEREPIGADGVTDLLYLNLKAGDMMGHKYGPESRETAEILLAIDEVIGKVVLAVESKVGQDQFVLVLTADHGMVPNPELTGGKRVDWKDLAPQLSAAFDANGDERSVFRGLSGYNLYLDKKELTRNGYALDDVKEYLMKHDGVLAAFTEDEVVANIHNTR